MTSMKKNMIIATAILAGSAAIVYALRKHFTQPARPTNQPVPRSHHRTNVFAKAKEFAVDAGSN